MTDQKNTILAIVLSALVLIGWQIYFGIPQMEKQKQIQQQQQQAQERAQPSGAPAQQPGAHAAARRAPAGGTGSDAAGAGPAGQLARPDPDPGSRAGGIAAGADRDAERRRLDRAQGRPDRRPRADQVPRDRRPQVAPDRAAGAVGQPAPVLFRIRLGRGGRNGGKGADRRYAVAAGGLGRARRRTPRDAGLRQRRRPRVSPHHRGRRQISLHAQGRGREQGRRSGDALPLRADLAPRHTADAGLLHPARGPDRRFRRTRACRKRPTPRWRRRRR